MTCDAAAVAVDSVVVVIVDVDVVDYSEHLAVGSV